MVEQIHAFFRGRNIALYTADRKQTNFPAGTSLASELAAWPDLIDLIIVVGETAPSCVPPATWPIGRSLSWALTSGIKVFWRKSKWSKWTATCSICFQAEYCCGERMMLEAIVCRGGKEQARHLALNDIVISRGPCSRIIKLDTYINHEFLESYTGDGIVVASPTGSTGYSLSAGGPIINPVLELLIIIPICPHSLYNRAVIITGSESVQLNVHSRQSQAVLTADGQVGLTLEDKDTITVRRAAQRVKLVQFADTSFYRLLRQKLKG